MTRDPNNTDELVQRAGGGDRQALADLFARHRDRLWRMIHLRLDRRLQGRLDPDDVLQETCLVYMQRFGEFASNPSGINYLQGRIPAAAGLHRRRLLFFRVGQGNPIVVFGP